MNPAPITTTFGRASSNSRNASASSSVRRVNNPARFGWFARYEIYSWATLLATLIFVWREPLQRWVQQARTYAIAAAAAAFLTVACGPYLEAVVLTPLAANNIYEQQYQMRRFVTESHAAPVGANDLGLISYRNDHYVLDLEGLASMETREARARRQAEGADAACGSIWSALSTRVFML